MNDSTAPQVAEVVRSLADLSAIEPEWREFLSRDVVGNNLFNDPQYLLARIELEPNLRPWIVVLRQHGQICCIAPFVLHDTRLKIEFSVMKLGSLPVSILKAIGGQFVLAADADPAECFRAVFEYLWSNRNEFGLVSLENLPAATSLWDYCQAESARDSRFRFFLASSQVDIVHQIRFPKTHGEFMSLLSYETRRKVRRYTRRLENTANIRLERITEPNQVPYFLEQLDRVHRETWQARVNGIQSRSAPSFTQYFSQLGSAGYLRCYLLSNADGPIAFALGHQHEGIYYFLETGYSQAWSDYGPGIVLMHLFFEDLMNYDRVEILDFICGNQSYKQSFSNDEYRAAFVNLTLPNRWRHLLRVQQLLHSLSRLAVGVMVKLKIDQRARKMLNVHH